jgi:hypothetical protein
MAALERKLAIGDVDNPEATADVSVDRVSKQSCTVQLDIGSCA